MTFNIGKPSDGVTDSQRIQRLYLYLNQMADKLNYALNNMDEQNLTRTFLASLTNGGDSDQQSTKGLKTEQVDEMIRDGRSSALLFSGSTAKAGDTITLNDSVDNYRLSALAIAGCTPCALFWTETVAALPFADRIRTLAQQTALLCGPWTATMQEIR